MTDDDKQGAEPDPWADLDAEAEPGGDAFNFDMLDDESGDAEKPPAAPQPMDGDDDSRPPSAGIDVPLAVFPPPETEPAPLDEDVRAMSDGPGADQPEIISMADVGGFDLPDVAAAGDAAGADDAFDDAQLAKELGFAGAEADPADFGDPAIDPPSDDVSFNADMGMAGDVSPFADGGMAEAFPQQADSSGEEMASIPLATAAVAATQALKKKKSGLGQLVGVVLGGVMALPITYAILIWGFQKDPFKLARKVPDQMAFLVPQSLREAARPSRPPQAAGQPAKAPSLDDLPAVADGEQPASPTGETMSPGGDPADAGDAAGKPVTPPASLAADDGDANEKQMADEAAPREGDRKPKDPFAGLAVPAELAEEFRAALAKLSTPDEFQAALARLNMPADMAPADMAPVEPEPVAPQPPAPPPLDLAGVEEAVAQATEALDALEAVPDLDDPVRKRLMVGWYRRLATLGEQLALLETAALDTGRPLDGPPEAVDGVLERIRGSDLAVEDLRTLGRMWLVAQKRRADGAVLVATVESTRRLGPYWSTRVNLAEADAASRGIAVISRMRPAADIGDQIIVTGVLFDADTVWAVDVRPLASVADVEVPAIGIPPTFEEPADPVSAVKPPMVEEPAPVRVKVPTADAATSSSGDAAPAAADSESKESRKDDSSDAPAARSTDEAASDS